jgi:hypothetical protein
LAVVAAAVQTVEMAVAEVSFVTHLHHHHGYLLRALNFRFK